MFQDSHFETAFRRELDEVMQIASGPKNKVGHHEIARLLAQKWQALGFQTTWSENRASFTAERVSKNTRALPFKLLLVGHLDTVYDEAPAIQIMNPTNRAQGIYGPALRAHGIADAKAGLISMLHLVREMDKQNEGSLIHWKIFVAADEESSSHRSRPHLLRFSSDTDLALVFEPGWYDPASGRENIPTHIGGNLIVKLEAASSSIHPAVADDGGVGTLDHLLQIARAVSELRGSGISVNIFQASTLSAPNLTPSKAKLGLAIRYANRDKLRKIERAISRVWKRLPLLDLDLRMTLEHRWQPLRVTSPALVRLIYQAYLTQGLPQPQPQTSLAKSDAYFLAQAGVQVIDGLGPLGGDLHSPTEHILLGSAKTRLKTQCSLLLQILANRRRTKF